MQDVTIRKYQVGDRFAIRRIACETAFLGETYQNFIANGEALADVLTACYTDYEPESCFVAESAGEIVGYIIGSLDVKRIRKIQLWRILPKAVFKCITSRAIIDKNSLRFMFHVILGLLAGDCKIPNFSKEYPATLHINLTAQFRGKGTGAGLINVFIKYLKENLVSGVHFGTMSENARGFFEKMGFRVLFSGKLTYLKYYFGKDLNYYVMGSRETADG